MKKVILNVPDDVAQDFGEKVKGLLSEFDIEADNDGVLDCLLPITERVKTFEDACKVLGEHHTLVGQYEEVKERLEGYSFENKAHLLAYQKLCIIAAALNEGWKPTFSKDEYRWFPWFRYYTKEEIEKMSEEERLKLGLVGAYASDGSPGGLAFVYSTYDWSAAYTSCGSRLAYKSEALADYSGKQFKDIWVDYVGKF